MWSAREPGLGESPSGAEATQILDEAIQLLRTRRKSGDIIF